MSLVQIMYYVIIAYSLIFIAIELNSIRKTANIYFFFIMVSNLSANIGHTIVATSTSVGEALTGMKLAYLGSVPICYFSFCLIAENCKVNLPKWLKSLLGCFAMFIIGCSLTIGKLNIFYVSAELVQENGISYLIKNYGPIHDFYVLIVLGYMIGSLLIALVSLFRPALVPKGMAFSLAGIQSLCIFVYFFERVLGLKFELLPYAYCIAMSLYKIFVRRQYLYDADRVAESIRQKNKDSAVFLFDKDRRYIGSNDAAKNIFEDATQYYVEQHISAEYPEAVYFDDLISSFEESTEAVNIPMGELGSYSADSLYEKGDRIYRVRVRRLINETIKGDRGYIIEFDDDTITQNHIRNMNEMNIKLEAAVEEANVANEAKSNFLASMSHEIRTPINAVLGMNSIILRDTKEEGTRDCATDIDNAGKSLLALINDILDFSKVEAGKMDIIPAEYNVSSLIGDCQSMIYNRLRDKGLEFVLSVDENTPSVLLGDEMRIRQVLTNLLTNAVKYTDHGTITMSVNYEYLSSSRVNFIVCVSDTGRGIAKEDQEHLFESFKRIDELKNRKIEGTGLGLALVQNLMALMSGDISVESEPGKGSAFTVRIPQEVVSKIPVGKVTSGFKKNQSELKMDDLSDTMGNILVVDDVIVNIKVITQLLKKSKLSVDTADSGIKALEKAAEKKYDIIFLDHMMPGMDGIETFHRLKQDDTAINANTPVVMLTANAIEGIKEEYLKEGFSDYLSKPVSYNALKDVINKYLSV